LKEVEDAVGNNGVRFVESSEIVASSMFSIVIRGNIILLFKELG